MTYEVRFLLPAEKEFYRLPQHLQRRFRELLPYLEANPYRSHPFFSVKDVGQVPGVWRFPLGDYRVFFKVDGRTVWIGKFWLRPPAYDEAHLRELRRAFHRLPGAP